MVKNKPCYVEFEEIIDEETGEKVLRPIKRSTSDEEDAQYDQDGNPVPNKKQRKKIKNDMSDYISRLENEAMETALLQTDARRSPYSTRNYKSQSQRSRRMQSEEGGEGDGGGIIDLS